MAVRLWSAAASIRDDALVKERPRACGLRPQKLSRHRQPDNKKDIGLDPLSPSHIVRLKIVLIMDNIINNVIVIIGWFVAFKFAIRANEKTFEKNKLFEKELLEINHENYKRSEFTKSCSSLASAIFRFHSDCSKTLSGLLCSKHDRSVLPIVFETFTSLQDQYIRLNDYYMKFDFWVKMSNWVSGDFKEIEHEFHKIFSPNVVDLEQQGPWFRYQKTIMQIQKYESGITKLQRELQEEKSVDQKCKNANREALEKALIERLTHLEHAIENILPILDATNEVTRKINEFCVEKNDDYQEMINPKSGKRERLAPPPHTNGHADPHPAVRKAPSD